MELLFLLLSLLLGLSGLELLRSDILTALNLFIIFLGNMITSRIVTNLKCFDL